MDSGVRTQAEVSQIRSPDGSLYLNLLACCAGPGWHVGAWTYVFNNILAVLARDGYHFMMTFTDEDEMKAFAEEHRLEIVWRET